MRELPEFMGTAFEEICRQFLIRQARKRSLPFVPAKIGKWWGNNPEKRRQKDAVQYRAAHSHLQLISFEEMAKISIA